MRAFSIIVFLFLKVAVIYCDGGHKVCHHNHKYHYLYHLHYLAFFALKFKVILVVGSIWAIVVLFGKILAAFKFAEYMKKESHSHPQVIYSSPPHDYHHYLDKSIEYSSPPKEMLDYSSSRIYNAPSDGYKSYPDTYKTLPIVAARNYLPKSKTPLENLGVVFNTIKKMNLTELVFKEMKITSDDCKRKFVCEADFNVKQSTIVNTIFNFIVDNCYVSYRPKNKEIKSIEDCAELYPKCEENNKKM